jgi:superfamily II DNA or RNA helicase
MQDIHNIHQVKKIFVPTLNNRGLILPKKYILDKFGLEYLKSFIIKTPQRIGPDKVAKLYYEFIENNAYMIALPRTELANLMEKGHIKKYINLSSKGSEINMSVKGTLTDLQNIVCDWLCTNKYNDEVIKQGNANCTLVMGAGKGKTFLAGGLIHRLKVNTLYIVPTKHLKTQATEDFRTYFNIPTVYQVKSKEVLDLLNGKEGAYDYRKADICVCVINTALKLPMTFFQSFGLTIFDEVHMYCSPTFSKVFWKGQSNMVLGLTATPSERKDMFDVVYKKCVGDVIYAESLVDATDINTMDVPFTGTVRAIKYYGPDDYVENKYIEVNGENILFTPAIIKQLIEDPYRNNMIVDEILNLYQDESLNIFAFSESRDHLLLINDILVKKLADTNIKSGVLRGGASKTQIALAVGSRIILTTYSYSGTGVSIKKMNALVFMTPRKSNMKQIIGRILRIGGDPTVTRKFIDIIDARTPLQYQFNSRKKAYEYYKFPITYYNCRLTK